MESRDDVEVQPQARFGRARRNVARLMGAKPTFYLFSSSGSGTLSKQA